MMSRGTKVQVGPLLRGQTFTNTEVLVTETCFRCGLLFAFPMEWQDRRRTDKTNFWCPNGHTQHYTRSEVDELRERLERSKCDLDGALDRLSAEKVAHGVTERERRRIVARVEAGVCIHCHRTFQNLAQHMGDQHGHVAVSDGIAGLGIALTALLVHKRRGYGWGQLKDGSPVRCRAERVPAVRAVHRWADVTCEDCKRTRRKQS